MKKILVVDNDRFMREFLENGLTKEGYKVITAEDGLSAVDILKTYTPEVIFVDLVMPNIDGKRLCKIIRGMDQLKDVYIIILSSIAAEEQIDIAELGANACIAKGPFHEMAKNILSVLDQSDLELAQRLSEEVIGIETSYPQEITKEFLSVKRHFEVILERMSEGILEVTSEGRTIYANPSAVSMFHLPEERLLGSLFVDLFAENDRKRIGELLKAVEEESKAITDNSPMGLNEFEVTINMVPIEGNGSTTVVILKEVGEHGLLGEAQTANVEALEKRIREQAAELSKSSMLLKLEAENRKGAEAALQKAQSQLENKIREQTDELSKRNELLKQELKSRKGVEAALQEACDELKDRVEEQTAELSKKDAFFKEESEHRKKAEEEFKKIRDERKRQVEEKTEALSKKDALLKKEIGNRKNAEETLKTTQEEIKKGIDEQAARLSKSNGLVKEEAESRKRAELALQISEERFNVFAELLPEALYEMDGRGNLTFFSNNGLDRFGYTKEDIKVGLNCFDMIAPEDRERMVENAVETLRGEKPGPEKYQALRKDGTAFTAMLYSAAILRDGEPVGLRGFIVEVADQEITEASLSKTQKVYGPLMELEFGDQTIEINEGRNYITMGRDSDSDLVFDQESASRTHAILVNRGDKFFLIDKSKNGTYVHIKGKQAVVVKQDEYLISGSGVIGLGCKVGPDSQEAKKFHVFK